MKNTPKVEEIRGIIKKLTGEKEKMTKMCTETSDKEKLKEKLKPYASALTNEEIEKLCSFFTSETELSDDKLAAVAGGMGSSHS